MTNTITEVWEQNVLEHADDRLDGPRGEWWFTGKRPESGACPGVEPNGQITSLAMPDLSVCSRQSVLDYFDNSWTLQETLFAGLEGTEAFYRPPDHNLRHPMIFYYGHPAALYVNKLRVAGLLFDPVNAYYERILETGVDEMSWDDLSKNDMLWPAVADVHAYRATVYALVRGIIEATDFAAELGRPVTMDDQAWALFMAFEHDRIHLETSSVLIRELPVRLVARHPAWPAPAPARRTAPDNEPSAGLEPRNDLLPVPGGSTVLGKPAGFPSYGWDNEYGKRAEHVDDFAASRYLVSNGEYYRFVADGGYRREELWSTEGWGWRTFRNVKCPRFWVLDGPSGLHRYRLRTIFEEIDMPWDWPVCVNYHEAKAFCAWRSERDGRGYRLPTEAEFRRIRALPEQPTVADDPILNGSGADLRADGVNLNLAWGSECPVDTGQPNRYGVHDAAGNVWQWCEDVAHALDGFEVHPYYEDFSTPCFDDEHQMILGGAFISTGDEASIWARYHFRPHFLQQSGIRIIEPSTVATDAQDQYASSEMLDRYLLLHFGSAAETFDSVEHPLGFAHGFPQRVAAFLRRHADQYGVAVNRVLDLGCAVGGTSFALADGTRQIVGVDSSASFVDTANRLAAGEPVTYQRPDQGEVTATLVASVPGPVDGVEFQVGDACALPDRLGRFDAVLLVNLLDRVGHPEELLGQFIDSDRWLAKGGLLLVASPWTWRPEYTEPDNWLGGRSDGASSERRLRTLLSGAFDLIGQGNEAAVLRDHRRHYEFLESDVSLWRKK